MKKLKLSLIIVTLLFVVVGCADNVTTEEILKDTITKSKDLKSVQVNAINEQTVKMNSEQETTTSSILALSINYEQPAVYQELEYKNNKKETMYITKNDLYALRNNAQWIKVEEYDVENFMKTIKELSNNVLEIFVEYTDDVELLKEDNQYILKLDGSGDKFMDIFKEQLTKTMPVGSNFDKLSEILKINSSTYEYVIDKKTGLIQKTIIDMDYELTILNNTMNFIQKTTSEFSNHNKVPKIIVPQEIIDSAITQ
jgi:uncharacterized protein DUF6612